MEPIRSELGIQRIMGRAAAQALVESDVALPMERDARSILYSQGCIENTGCRCLNGQVLCEGVITLQLLCQSQTGEPFGMRAQTQYTHPIPMEAVREGMEATVQPQLMDLRCALREGRVHVEAVAGLDVLAQERASIPVISDMLGMNDLQKQYIESEQGEWRLVGEDLVRLHETLSAPAVSQVLLTSAETQVNHVSLSEDGADVRGTLYLNILYTDDNDQYQHIVQQVPFETTVPMELDTRTCLQLIGNTHVQNIAVSLGMEPGTLDVEAALALRALCLVQNKVEMLADAYAPESRLQCGHEHVEQLSAVSCATKVCTFNESLRIPEGMPDAYRTVFVSARPTMLGITNDSGQLGVDGLFIASVVYQTDQGMLMGFEEDIPFHCTLDAPYMPDAQITLKLLEARGNGSGRTINAMFVLGVYALLRELQQVDLVVDLQPAEAIARENGIFVNFASPGETFWDIGKRFGVTQEALKGWNANVKEPFSEGQPIVVLSAAGRKQKV